MPRIDGTYAMKDWQEEACRDEPVPLKLTRVHTYGDISGGFTGTGHTFYLIAYTGDSGPYTGYTQFTGTLDGRTGSFVMAEEGVFAPGTATSQWRIVEGSGTDGLAGITGTGGFRAANDFNVPFSLDYDFDA